MPVYLSGHETIAISNRTTVNPCEIGKTHVDRGLHDATPCTLSLIVWGDPVTAVCLRSNTAMIACGDTKRHVYLGCTQYGPIRSRLDVLNTLAVCLHYNLIS